MRLKVSYDRGSFQNGMRGISDVIGSAAAVAVKHALDDARNRGRSDILASGLGSRWAASLKSKFYPNNGMDAAGIVYSSIAYSVVFENGARIKGNPVLWIPLPSTPKLLNGKRLTAGRFSREVGRLFKIKIGGKDYLAAKVAASGSRSSRAAVPLSAIRRGGSVRRGQRTRLVPMFVAASATSIRKRLHIGQIVEQAADRLPDYYASAVKDD